MSLLLAIETAGSNCSAALADGATVLASASRAMRHGHAEALMPIVDRVMREAGIAPRRLDHVAVAIGPGGFTGIRVGLAAAQGIARGAGASPIGITSFACIAVRVGAAAAGEGRALLVALDSRREDLYLQLFSGDGAVPLDGPQALLPGSLAAYIGSIVGRTPLLIAGDAAATAAAALEPHQVGAVRGELVPDALGVAAAARCQLAAGGVPEPLRPLYLRPPDVSLKPAPVPTAPVTLSIAPIAPAGAALVAALHGAAFPEDPWDAPAIAQVLLMPGAFGFVASLGDAPSGFVLACDLGREVEILARCPSGVARVSGGR
jgi:tRNA threonylcarbamoyladenosine biosynthesis protein TsaB